MNGVILDRQKEVTSLAERTCTQPCAGQGTQIHEACSRFVQLVKTTRILTDVSTDVTYTQTLIKKSRKGDTSGYLFVQLALTRLKEEKTMVLRRQDEGGRVGCSAVYTTVFDECGLTRRGQC